MQTGYYEHTSDYIKKLIIKWFLGGGFAFQPKSSVIGNEVLFSARRRHCDLLVMNEDFHAFEIKGNADNLSKLPSQIVDYRKTFDFVSIIATPKHVKRIVSIVPKSFGIVTIENDDIEIQRMPRQHSTLNKESLLMFMGRQKLLSFLRQQKNSHSSSLSQFSVGELRHFIARKYPVSVIRELAYQSIKETYTPLFLRFLQETKNYPILIDDVRSLSAHVASSTPMIESDSEE